MIRELFVPVAEWLFWFTGGEMLINTVWIVPWVFGGAVLMLIPFVLAISAGRNRIHSLPALVFLVTFFPMLLLITSPGIIQLDLLQECRTVTALVTILDHTSTEQIHQCRIKQNWYDAEYGDWRTLTK